MTKVYTYNYDSTYDPAMPVVDIEIGRAGAEPAIPLIALVDSGADGTIIPIRYLSQIRARRYRRKWMRGTVGGRKLVDLYLISLKLGPFVSGHLAAVGR
jgi:hypothetical protein